MATFNINKVSLILVVFLSLFEDVQSDFVEIETPAGHIRGQLKNVTQGHSDHVVTEFLGIPYAESTAGNKRFTKPVRKARFQTVFNATRDGIFCPMDNQYPGLMDLPLDEDCLVLNVIVPGRVSNSTSIPVMIWIHGGGFQLGFQDGYVAPGFAAQSQVILVTINYRVSIYGFLAVKQLGLLGNYGLWDQHMAILWVHNNIASFGGDPGQITLFGESAGAASVLYQAMYKGNVGMIHGIIAQSGTPNAPWALDRTPLQTFHTFLKNSPCSNNATDDVVECLRKTDLKDLKQSIHMLQFLPVIDGDFVIASADDLFKGKIDDANGNLKHFRDLNVIIGFNSYEMFFNEGMANGIDFSQGLTFSSFNDSVSVFVDLFLHLPKSDLLQPALLNQYFPWHSPDDKYRTCLRYFDLMSDASFIVPSVETAYAHVRGEGTGNLFMYVFDYRPSFSKAYTWVDGATHAAEIPFVLGLPLRYQIVFGHADPNQNDIDLSNAMMTYWAQFAKTGNPNSDSLPEWTPYTFDRQVYIVFQGNKTSFDIRDRPKAKEVHFWDTFVPKLLNQCPADVTSGVACAKMEFELLVIVGLLILFLHRAIAT